MKKIDSIYSDKNSNYSLVATIIGLDNDDVVVVVTGGYDHIGAIGLAIPRPSLEDQNCTSATSSILTMLGHKEDVVARYVSEKVAAATNRNVVVIAGIHYDNLAQEDLETLHEQWVILTKKIIAHINQ
ncbi:MAG TPA: hypothetical protein ENF28_02445 [Proteobacteria bacterium]|nr:hypothetical protein [Pseudomonadota bacterium]